MISEVFNPALPNPLTTAVKACTALAESKPESLVNIRASLTLRRVSSAPNPCLANSTAAFVTVSKVWLVFLATSNNPSEKD